MEELRQEIDRAYRLISSALVSGDAVDAVAATRQCLRNAYKMAAPKDRPKEGDHG